MKTARIQLTLEPELKEQIDRAALEDSLRAGERISTNEWIRRAIRRQLEER